MKIILRKDVENLASGEVVTVKDGYARNFLIPRGFALKATPGNLKVVEGEKKVRQRALEKEKRNAQELAKRLSTISCTVSMRIGEDGKMFGSVTSSDIAKALEIEGIKIDKKAIELASPIREIGVFHVPVKLHPEINADVKVWVVSEAQSLNE